jgi:hypothetical protein
MLRKAFLLVALASAACSARQGMAPPSAEPSDRDVAKAAPAPPPLDRSLFSRAPEGTLSEEELQAILARPLELELPARVGVLPIIEAADWRGPGPSHEMVPAGLSKFAHALPSDDGFSLVTEMMPIPSGGLGMEALREVAARYKLRYLLLYREHVVKDRRGNGFAAAYATGVGALFMPGSTLEVHGYAEATLFDVKTGILLYTVRRRLEASRRSTVWQRKRKLDDMQQTLAVEAATTLAQDARKALLRFREVTKDAADVGPNAVAETPSPTVGASQ